MMKGIDENAGRKISVLAHCMGGLVGRWFVEQEGGNQMVDQLAMCGTPNEGTPFGSIGMAASGLHNLANLTLDFLPTSVTGCIKTIQKTLGKRSLTTTLAQTSANSDFMHQLNSSDDPGIGYLIFAGDISEYVKTASDERLNSLLVKTGASPESWPVVW